jgi:hypothetical protein
MKIGCANCGVPFSMEPEDIEGFTCEDCVMYSEWKEIEPDSVEDYTDE